MYQKYYSKHLFFCLFVCLFLLVLCTQTTVWNILNVTEKKIPLINVGKAWYKKDRNKVVHK